MTIYTPGQADKQSKNTPDPEVVTEPLTSFKEDDYEAEMAPKLVRVTYFPRNRRTFCVHLFLTVMVMIVLTCGAIGAVVFYRHLNKKQVYSGVCGTRFYDQEYHELRGDVMDNRRVQDQAPPQAMSMYKAQYTLDFLEEGIEVSRVDEYEQLHTPRFDEVRENTVWHDFQSNYTAIIDRNLGSCYIMRLNRTAVAPPSDVLDLLEKLMSGYYMKSAAVIRENYRLVRPAIDDLTPFGSRIEDKCSYYQTFWLEKYVHGVSKRDADQDSPGEFTLVYAVLSNRMENPRVYKVIVTGADDPEEDADQDD